MATLRAQNNAPNPFRLRPKPRLHHRNQRGNTPNIWGGRGSGLSALCGSAPIGLPFRRYGQVSTELRDSLRKLYVKTAKCLPNVVPVDRPLHAD